MDNPTRRTLTRLEKGFHAVVAVCITTALFVLERLTEPMTSGGSVEGHFIFLAGTMGLVSASLSIYSLWSRRRQKVIREPVLGNFRHQRISGGQDDTCVVHPLA
ncbi:protein of unknown function [Magnetospirillum sp. XM-1]|uniref:hypothetical protein n=1 Tax=Magnetospirillum sp. XM-1 TaxID=1663591 RepID=UPI00073DDB94|nr:hypothetical protein [Magnetospirillum sp. XM-1]CUW37714.1 protein of unknown function [Magnetospirillum sp. XM-1]